MSEISNRLKNQFSSLIKAYLDHDLDADTFKREYMCLWNRYRGTSEHYCINKNSGGSVDRIFTALDCYCPDPDLRREYELDEHQLRAEVQEIFQDLRVR